MQPTCAPLHEWTVKPATAVKRIYIPILFCSICFGLIQKLLSILILKSHRHRHELLLSIYMKQHCHGQYEEIRKPGDMEVGDVINVPESLQN